LAQFAQLQDIMNRTSDVIVVGAGAAGLMCAIEAGKRHRSVVVLERNDSVGKKIRISGGGRCNFTNLYASPDNFVSENPNFHKSALARYTPLDFIAVVKRHGIKYHEKKLGQLFCDGSSQQIIDMLQQECTDAKVSVLPSCTVESVEKRNDRFIVATNLATFDCSSLVIATGGLSIPQIGATDFAYTIAKQFGLQLTPVRPALVPLVLAGPEAKPYRELHGIAVDAIVQYRGAEFRENILFTHRGLSGPAILQISLYWQPGGTITIDLLPEKTDVRDLPKRLAQTWTALHAPAKPAGQWSRKEQESFSNALHQWAVVPSGTEGYAKAEVTAGGVDTRELSRTMEAKKVQGLYFVGEAVDVTGQLGGFNFQWAWASGFVAGQAAGTV
jgi:predicted flavoprotein YhiN